MTGYLFPVFVWGSIRPNTHRPNVGMRLAVGYPFPPEAGAPHAIQAVTSAQTAPVELEPLEEPTLP